MLANEWVPTAVRMDVEDGQFDVWREHFCDRLVAADVLGRPPDRLGATLDLTLVGGVVAMDARVRFDGLGLARGPGRVAGGKDEAIGLSVILEGSALVMTTEEHELHPGDVCLLHSGFPFRKRMSAAYRELFLYVPNAIAVPALGGALEDHGPQIAPRHGLAPILVETLRAAAGASAPLSGGEWRTLLDAVLAMSAAIFAPRPRSHTWDRARASGRAAQRARVLRFLDAHLGDPELAPPAIARALRMSTRYLHLLFHGGDSVGTELRHRRLERAAELLRADVGRARTITEVALACGFNDSAHFSRAFRARFGHTPRDARAAAPLVTPRGGRSR